MKDNRKEKGMKVKISNNDDEIKELYFDSDRMTVEILTADDCIILTVLEFMEAQQRLYEYMDEHNIDYT